MALTLRVSERKLVAQRLTVTATMPLDEFGGVPAIARASTALSAG
jgi:hypothetical protein